MTVYLSSSIPTAPHCTHTLTRPGSSWLYSTDNEVQGEMSHWTKCAQVVYSNKRVFQCGIYS